VFASPEKATGIFEWRAAEANDKFSFPIQQTIESEAVKITNRRKPKFSNEAPGRMNELPRGRAREVST